MIYRKNVHPRILAPMPELCSAQGKQSSPDYSSPLFVARLCKQVFFVSTYATPSLNDIKGKWGRLNWKKKYLRAFSGYELVYGLKSPARRRLTIQRFGSRTLDLDNYHGGCKALIDALKEIGILWDDSPKWADIVFLDQVFVPRGEGRTEIRVEEIRGAE